jgi:hypothetical protein
MTTRDDYEPPRRCELCGGDGWAPAPPRVAHNPLTCNAEPGSEACRCHAVIPCRCTGGRHTHTIVDKIEDARHRLSDAVQKFTKPATRTEPT